MIHIHTDFETRSTCDLLKEGAYRYATDPTTEIMLASFAIDDGPIIRWRPGDDYPFHNIQEPFQIVAFNAQFERLIWSYVCTNDHDWPDLDLEHFVCVAATARANALPGKLENTAKALKLKHQKDMAGHRLMMKMCRPKEITDDGTIIWHEDIGDINRLHDYCDKDVLTERDILSACRPLNEREQQAYWDCEHINDRGLHFDSDFANAALGYAVVERDYFTQQLSQLTNGEITTARQFARIKTWLEPRICNDVRSAMKVYVKGEPKQKFDAAVRHNLLAMDDEAPGFLSPEVRDLTEIIHEAGKSSISKYQTLLNRGLDDTVQGLYMAFGAGQTGRYSSVGVQVHNLKRDVMEDTEHAVQEFINGDPQFESHWNDRIDKRAAKVGGIVNALALLLRPTFTAEKHWLCWSDWSAIEARALPWLANSRRAQAKIDIFKECDADPELDDVYVRNAKSIGLYTDDGEPFRQGGKVAELSLGYGGGVGAFNAMARNYDVYVDDKTALRIRDGWRDANAWAVEFWDELWTAANAAFDNPDQIFHAGRLSYLYTPGTHNGQGTLWCKLPVGRVIAYPYVTRELQDTPWGEQVWGLSAIKGNWKPKQNEDDWPRFKIWKGLLAENADQATCADLMIDAISNALDADADIRGHTHDELLGEFEDPEYGMRLLNEIMETNEAWSEGLPLKAEAGYGKRYKEKK